MVSAGYMARSALAAGDTAMARAFLRALGIPVPSPAPRGVAVVPAGRYGGMAECFANGASPMDGRA